MTESHITPDVLSHASWQDYLELCKPKVVLLMVLTSVIGMCLASPHLPSWRVLLWGNIGIALAAAAAAVVNHLADYRIDQVMARTQQRPIVKGRVSMWEAIIFSFSLCLASIGILLSFTNILTTLLTLLSLVIYAGVYTFYLKHATPQNIVIGGIAGAAPPLLGWVAVTDHVSLTPLILVAIIFIWTPPHFWALAIHRVEDYAKANVPMLPNTHGIPHTKRSIVIYSVLLWLTAILPSVIGNSHRLYFFAAAGLSSWFLYWAIQLYRDPKHSCAMKLFHYSIIYLFAIFMALLVDHYCLL